jgi:uncharacterized membrane protein
MRIIKILLVCCVAGAVVHYVKTHRSAPTAAAEEAPPTVSSQGFVELPRIRDAQPDQVLIVAPQNCPREAGQRAGALEQALNREGIPAVRTANVAFPVSGQADAKGPPALVDQIMMGELPIVIINGRAKNNPGLASVEAEYRSSRGHSN